MNNTRVLSRRIEDPVTVEADLSAFAGQEVDLRIFQRGAGIARWKGIRLR